MLLQKKPSELEVYNDIDGEVVNYFRMLREQPEKLIAAIGMTPFARAEYVLCFEDTEDPLERARRLYVRAFQSYGSHTNRKSGWRWGAKSRKHSGIGSWDRIEHLWLVAERLKRVLIEQDSAAEIVSRYDEETTLFYCDPPYIETALSSSHRYRNSLSETDHLALLEQLKQIRGMAVVSMVSHPIYEKALAGWRQVVTSTVTQNGGRMQECLWISPRAFDIQMQSNLI